MKKHKPNQQGLVQLPQGNNGPKPYRPAWVTANPFPPERPDKPDKEDPYTVPGPGNIAGISPFSLKCKGPVVSKSKECIALRKAMNQTQAKRINKLVRNLSKSQGLHEKAAGEVKVGDGSKWGGDYANDLSAGRWVPSETSPKYQKDMGGVMGLRTGEGLVKRIEKLTNKYGQVPETPVDVYKWSNADRQDAIQGMNGLAETLLGAGIALSDDDIQLIRKNGETGRYDPLSLYQWFMSRGRKGGEEDEYPLTSPEVYELEKSGWFGESTTPNTLGWWENNWRTRTLGEEAANVMGGNFDTALPDTPEFQSGNLAGPIGPLGTSTPVVKNLGPPNRYTRTNRKREQELLRRLLKNSLKINEAQDIEIDKTEDPFNRPFGDDRPGGWWSPPTNETKPVVPVRPTWSWQEDFDGDGIPDTIYRQYPGGIIVRHGVECCGKSYHYFINGVWYIYSVGPDATGNPQDGTKLTDKHKIRGGWGASAPPPTGSWEPPDRFGPRAINPRKD